MKLTPDCGPHCYGKMDHGRYVESHCSCPKCHGKVAAKWANVGMNGTCELREFATHSTDAYAERITQRITYAPAELCRDRSLPRNVTGIR